MAREEGQPGGLAAASAGGETVGQSQVFGN